MQAEVRDRGERSDALQRSPTPWYTAAPLQRSYVAPVTSTVLLHGTDRSQQITVLHCGRCSFLIHLSQCNTAREAPYKHQSSRREVRSCNTGADRNCNCNIKQCSGRLVTAALDVTGVQDTRPQNQYAEGIIVTRLQLYLENDETLQRIHINSIYSQK